MRSLAEVELEDFEAALGRQQVLLTQLVHLGLGSGVVVLGAFVLAAQYGGLFRPPQRLEGSLLVVQVLTMFHVAAVLVGAVAGKWLSEAQFRPERLARAVARPLRDAHGGYIEEPAHKCLTLIRRAHILRHALLEGPATMGLVTCLLAVIFGVMDAHPGYGLNAASGGLYLLYNLLTFPTHNRLKTVFVEKIVARRT